MAFSVCKGTALQIDIAAALTTIGQVVSIDGPSMEGETTEIRTLDNADSAIGKMATGYTDFGEISFELFFDPVLANHQAITDLLTTPPAPAGHAAKLIFADTGATGWTFNIAGVSLSPAVDMADGLKASCGMTVAGLVSLPT